RFELQPRTATIHTLTKATALFRSAADWAVVNSSLPSGPSIRDTSSSAARDRSCSPSSLSGETLTNEGAHSLDAGLDRRAVRHTSNSNDQVLMLVLWGMAARSTCLGTESVLSSCAVFASRSQNSLPGDAASAIATADFFLSTTR